MKGAQRMSNYVYAPYIPLLQTQPMVASQPDRYTRFAMRNVPNDLAPGPMLRMCRGAGWWQKGDCIMGPFWPSYEMKPTEHPLYVMVSGRKVGDNGPGINLLSCHPDRKVVCERQIHDLAFRGIDVIRTDRLEPTRRRRVMVINDAKGVRPEPWEVRTKGFWRWQVD